MPAAPAGTVTEAIGRRRWCRSARCSSAENSCGTWTVDVVPRSSPAAAGGVWIAARDDRAGGLRGGSRRRPMCPPDPATSGSSLRTAPTTVITSPSRASGTGMTPEAMAALLPSSGTSLVQSVPISVGVPPRADQEDLRRTPYSAPWRHRWSRRRVPAGPWGASGPTGPSSPSGPSGPAGPAGPCRPVSPCTPWMALSTVYRPSAPEVPWGPVAPPCRRVALVALEALKPSGQRGRLAAVIVSRRGRRGSRGRPARPLSALSAPCHRYRPSP